MLTLPVLPFPVRAYNEARRLASRFGLPVGRLDADVLMENARRSTELSDFGPDTFREPLERLIASLAEEAGLTALGYTIAAQQLTDALENRLRLNACIAAEPRITQQRISRPVFIVGMPRTGTSILHELVAQDPNLRVPLTWEA